MMKTFFIEVTVGGSVCELGDIKQEEVMQLFESENR